MIERPKLTVVGGKDQGHAERGVAVALPPMPPTQIFAFVIGTDGTVATIDGQFHPFVEGMEALTAHLHACHAYGLARILAEQPPAPARTIYDDIRVKPPAAPMCAETDGDCA
jgi:hypothetical protein